MPLPTPELQARWRRYFADNLQGTDREVDAATKAAMAALVRGESDDRVRAAGLAAVSRLRGTSRPSMAKQARRQGQPPSPAASSLDPEEWRGPSQSQPQPQQAGVVTPAHSNHDRVQSIPGSTMAGNHGPVTNGPRVPAPSAGAGLTKFKHGDSTVIRGTARAVQQRTFGRQQAQREILSLRVERYDNVTGNRLDPVPVELRGAAMDGRIVGQVSEGDEVEVSGKWHRGTLRASSIANISTGAQISGMSSAKNRRRILLTIASVVVAFATFFGGFAVFASCQQQRFEEHGKQMQRDGYKEYCETLQEHGMQLDAKCREILGGG